MSEAQKSSEIPIGTVFGLPEGTHLVTTSKPFKSKKYGPKDNNWYVKVKCSCGSPEKEALVSQLRSGRTKSCGCRSRKLHWDITRGAHLRKTGSRSS